MIDHRAKNHFHDIITNEMFEMDRTLAAVMGATQARAYATGTLMSGSAMVLLTADATNSLKARGQVILGQLLRCLTAFRVELTDENLAEAITIVRDHVVQQAMIVRDRLMGCPQFNRQGPAFETAGRQLLSQFDQEPVRLANRLATELSVTAAASSIPPAKPGSTYTFNAPVALVQTGDGNQATVTQHVTAELRTEVSRTLDEILFNLNSPASGSFAQKEQLREVVIDAKEELEKPSPNPLKLSTSLRAIAETTKFVGSLGPAYQAIKPLLSYFGVHMP